MRERGIHLNREMVRAVLEGRKTQTRRIMRVQPESNQYGLLHITDSTKRSEIGKYHWAESNATGTHTRSALFSCPFGTVGDRLWVRESCFAENGAGTSVDSGSKLVYFPADMGSFVASSDQETLWEKLWCYGKGSGGQVVPSIHMPRWASRITLEITGVRVERLQAISEDDAKAEGAPTECCVLGDKHFLGFRSLWRSIYGEESWQANPWVWVIEFKRVEG